MNITGGKFNKRKILSPKSDLVRPTSSKIRESVFNMLYGMKDFSGLVFLDLFAGSGIMGLEAYSRGGERCVFVEKNKSVFSALRKTLEAFEGDFQCYNTDALKFLDFVEEKFDVIFIDPPYYEGFYDKVLDKIRANSILKEDGLLIVETPKELKLQEGLDILKEKIYGTTKISFVRFSF